LAEPRFEVGSLGHVWDFAVFEFGLVEHGNRILASF
jgi:hypothetical protein